MGRIVLLSIIYSFLFFYFAYFTTPSIFAAIIFLVSGAIQKNETHL